MIFFFTLKKQTKHQLMITLICNYSMYLWLHQLRYLQNDIISYVVMINDVISYRSLATPKDKTKAVLLSLVEYYIKCSREGFQKKQ